MIIIVEGCDGAGKSTFVDQLATQVYKKMPAERVRIEHKGPMTTDAINEYEGPLEDYYPGGSDTVLCDRWHIGEFIYGPMLRGECKVSNAERLHIEKFLAARGAVLVLMAAPTDMLIDRVGARGDELVATTQLREIASAYHREIYRTAIPTFMIWPDYEESEVHAILHHAIRQETYATRTSQFGTYVGPPSPSYLILGERRGPGRDQYDGRGAFTPVSATSGRYLLDHLPMDVADTCGIANACEEDIGSLWEILGQPLIVALGNEAAAMCAQAELPHGIVPHPQFVRRFHHARGAEYGDVIREALIHGKDLRGAFSHSRT